MRKTKIIILIAAVFFITAFSSDQMWKRIFSVSVQSDFFTTDNLGNFYAIHSDQITKYNLKGELLKKYSNKRLGKIYSVDASNPLRILVYYKDFSVIVILDSQLTENGENILLEQYDLEQCDLACNSFNNGVWLFNRQNMELIRLNESLEKLVSTGNLNLLLGLTLRPNFLVEYNGYVYLNDPEIGILIFDIFGTYYKTVYLKSVSNFQVKENEIIFFASHKACIYRIKELKQEGISVPDTSVVQIQYQKNHFYFLYRDSISIYKAE